MEYRSEPIPKEQQNRDKLTCTIDGDTFPLFYARIINEINYDGQPIICVHGEQGHGKSYAAAKIAYDMHEKINLCIGDLNPEEQIHFDTYSFLSSTVNARRQAMMLDEAGANLNSKDYNKSENRKNDNIMQISRVFHNILIYASPYHSDLDSSIRKNCVLKIVATGGPNNYKFKVYRVKVDAKDPTSQPKDVFLQTWKPKQPPKEIREYLDNRTFEDKEERANDEVEELAEIKGLNENKEEKMKKQF